MSQETNPKFEQIQALEFFMEQCIHEGQAFFEEGNIDSLTSEDMIEQRFRESFAKDLADFSRDEEVVFNEDQLELAQNIYERVAGDIAAARTEYAGNERDCDFYNYFQDEQDWFQERLDYLYVEAEDTPEFKLAELAEHRNESIRKGVANHSNTISGTLDELVEEFPYEVAHNSDASAEAMAYAAEQALNNSNRFPDNEAQEILEAVAWGNNTNSETLAMIAGDESDENILVRVRVAGHPNAPVEALKHLAHDWDNDVRFYVARNANTPSAILDILSNDENSYRVRMAVARNESTPVETLNELSNDENSRVRHWVAQNENTSIETLVKLSKDEQFRIRSEIARNENTPYETKIEMAELENDPYVIEALANDEDRHLRTLISANQHTDARTLERLYQEANSAQPLEDEAEYDAEFTDIDEMNNGYDEEIRMNVATHKNTSKELLESVEDHSWKDPEFGYRHFETDEIKAAAENNLAQREQEFERSKEQTKETKNKYAAKYQKTSEALDERDASAGLGE